MKFFKNAVKAASAAIMALLLVGCGEKQNKTTVGNDGNTAYQTAISNLETGDNKQAYSELKAVDEKSLSVKAQKLRNNLKYLLAAKKALTGNDVEEAEKNLANLDNVTSPDALVKQIKKVQREYQIIQLANRYYEDVTAYYKAGKYSEAGGSLQALNSLSNSYQAVENLQYKASKYDSLIAQAQNESVSKAESASSESGYTNARNSKLMSSQYEKATGSDISSADNSEISSFASSMTNDEVLNSFRTATKIPQEAGDQYYMQETSKDNYQIEIRHTSDSNTQVSNLKGMYQFNSATKKARKLNEISGDYEDIN